MSFQIYEDEFYSGMYEVEMQNTEAFNAASNNAIRLIPREHIGNFSKEAFFTETADVITRRDITSNDDGTAVDLASDELVGVKLYRRFQYDKKLGDIKRIGFTEQEYSFFVGQQIATAKMKSTLNTGLLSLMTALGTEANNFTADTSETLNYDLIPPLLAKFGDASQNLRHIVGHSKPIHNLLGDSFTVQVENVAGFSINTGGIPTLNRGLSMTDSSALVDPTGTGETPDVASYKTAWLTENALRLEESEDETMWSGIVDGKENLVVRVQGEYAITVKVKGFEYSSATANPLDAALATAGNWDQVASDTKSTAGVYLETA